MPLLNSCTCTGGLVAAAALVLLLLPAQYLVPQLAAPATGEPCPAAAGADTGEPGSSPPSGWLPPLAAPQLPVFYLIVSAVLVAVTALIYLSEWIQRKLKERRIIKLNQYLAARVESLRARDAQRELVEAKLRMVRQASSEYNVLLYLLLQRQRRCPPGAGGKDADEAFTRPALES